MVTRFTAAILLSTLVLGCTAEWKIPEGYVVECVDNSDCPDTAECTLTDDGSARICVTAGETWCGNGVQEVGEACDDGNQETGDYCAPDCTAVTTVCGDGLTQGNETCDYLGQIDGWYCDDDCMGFSKICGDEHIAVTVEGRLGEVCDQGDANSNDYQTQATCLTDCSGYGSFCGDDVVDPEEACDNPDPLSGCTATCQKANDVVCGDLTTHSAFEECDDGNTLTETCNYGDALCYICNAECQIAPGATSRCGDGIIDSQYEVCDAGTQGPTCTEVSSVFEAGSTTCREDCQSLNAAECVANRGKMVLIPAGDFQRGCNVAEDAYCSDFDYLDEYPAHTTAMNAYSIDIYEVTVGDYKDCVNTGSCNAPPGVQGNDNCNYNYTDRSDHPMNCVNYIEAQNFCSWAQKGLPTEAQWEKAARGNDFRVYPWGNEQPTCEDTVSADCPEVDGTMPVGSKPTGASPYGVMDMAGNVWEWVADWYGSDYYCEGDNANTQSPFYMCADFITPNASIQDNPTGPASGLFRGIRGGAFNYGSEFLRTSYRDYFNPYDSSTDTGFRCAQSVP